MYEQEIWVKYHRKLLAELTEVIKYHPLKNDERWVKSALPALRTMYKKVRDSDHIIARRTLSQMCGIINSFNKNSGLVLMIGIKKDEGSEYKVKSMWLGFTKGSKWYKIREALALIEES